ncbi:hypothetical protein [Noviherbaspirillum aridicola]|uniref:DUF5666 domain-containing protein n=1 Tax=Noviherbaspirillum aridicola TaxID=2849687 RepID=A0ABQ4Q429_9BURK|nr:hypothetical protein [Noviherbaspirillum aridicola]GIZ51914.1 hypothetical protein NCCP691_19280 [Noviherbaspirillum aridicola]
MKNVLAAAFASISLLVSLPSFAQGAHAGENPQYGGVLAEVKGTQYELVAKSDSITIYVDDHGKKVSTTGATGKATLLNGSEKTEVNLAPAGENRLEAKGTFKVDKGTKVVAVVSLQGKPAQSVRFTVK